MKTSFISFTLPLLALLAGTARTHAADHTWTGTGPNKNWSTSSNWAGNSPPVANEATPVRLIFPAGAGQLSNSCDIAGLTVDSIYFNGSNYQVGYVYQFPKPIKMAGGGLYSSGVGNSCSVPLILDTQNLNFGISTGAELHLFSALSGSGGFQKTGRGKLFLEGDSDNSFAASATVLVGELHLKKAGGHLALSSPLIVGDTSGSAVGGGPDSTVLLDGDQQMPFGTPLTINPDGLLNMNGHSLAVGSLTMIGNSMIDDYTGTGGTLTLLGNVYAPHAANNLNPKILCNISLGGSTRTFYVDQSYLSVGGHVSNGGASAGIVKTGAGYLTFSATNTYTGDTVINDGTVSFYYVSDTTNVIVNSPGTLTGMGVVGTVNVHNAILNPVAYDSGTTDLLLHTTAKDVTLDGGSTFQIELNNDLLKPQPFLAVNGTVNLGGAKFSAELETDEDFDPVINSSFILIFNDGIDPVIGTFAGIPEGGTVKFGGRLWKITYQGNGTKWAVGNDVVLTMLTTQLPLSLDSINMNEIPNYIALHGTGAPDTDYRCESSVDLKVWQEIGYVTNSNGSLSYFPYRSDSGDKCFFRFVQHTP